MTTPASSVTSQLDGPNLDAGLPVAIVSVLRPYYWAVRRELWEHRSLIIAPVVVSGLMVVAILLNITHLHELKPMIGTASHAQRWVVANFALALPVLFVSMTMWVVAAFYALDSLHSERRDRSILFWKSLPVSDTVTVLSKLSIPLIVTPIFTFVAALVSQLTLVVAGALALQASGVGALTYLRQLELVDLTMATVYMLAASSLWYAPMYAWFMLVSVWSRRNALLWALLMPSALSVLERVAFHTTYLGSLIADRITGLAPAALRTSPQAMLTMEDLSKLDVHLVLSLLDPLGFVSDVHLWLGLVVAGVFSAATIWLRRHSDPI